MEFLRDHDQTINIKFFYFYSAMFSTFNLKQIYYDN